MEYEELITQYSETMKNVMQISTILTVGFILLFLFLKILKNKRIKKQKETEAAKLKEYFEFYSNQIVERVVNELKKPSQEQIKEVINE